MEIGWIEIYQQLKNNTLVFHVYAISKLSRSQLPVVIDTPVSRMDKEHKGWSVTRFYPKLAHQVIVLTTSDDLRTVFLMS